ncbi:MAG: hypothetical protein R6U36_11270 [Candidatus Fermentibacteraceae bacterium]
MKDVETKKAIAFIKENAVDAPKVTRGGTVKKYPEELVNTIRQEIENHDGEFAVKAKEFNEVFGYKGDNLRNYYIKKKLNRDYPFEDEKEWHVGSRNNGEFYVFTIHEVETEE